MKPSRIHVETTTALKQLAPTDRLRDALSIDATNATAVAELQQAIIAATATAENHCRQVLRRQTIKNTWYTRNGNPLYLRPAKWPLEPRITSITMDGQDIHAQVYVAPAQLIERIDGQPFTGQTIIASIEQGFEPYPSHAATVPEDLTQAVLDLSRQIYLRRNRSPDVTSERLSDVAHITYLAEPHANRASTASQLHAIPSHIAQVLNAYATLGVAL